MTILNINEVISENAISLVNSILIVYVTWVMKVKSKKSADLAKHVEEQTKLANRQRAMMYIELKAAIATMFYSANGRAKELKEVYEKEIKQSMAKFNFTDRDAIGTDITDINLNN